MYVKPTSSFKTIDDDYHHLLTFKDIVDEKDVVVKTGMDDVMAFLSLLGMALFANVLDKRTYMPFVSGVDDPSPEELEEQRYSDINAIPLLERRHYAYSRGLAFDLIGWFHTQFGFINVKDEDPDDVDSDISIPFIGQLAFHLLRYKEDAEEIAIPGACTLQDFAGQVEMAVSRFGDLGDAFDSFQQGEQFEINDYILKKYESTTIYESVDDFFHAGKTTADEKYFAALDGQTGEGA